MTKEKVADNGIDDTLLVLLIEDCAASMRLTYNRNDIRVTPELREVVNSYCRDLEKALSLWVSRNPGALKPERDISNLVDERGAYLVLMTLMGNEDQGIWDGAWDYLFVNPRKSVRSLDRYVVRALRKHAHNGTGPMSEVLRAAAYAAKAVA